MKKTHLIVSTMALAAALTALPIAGMASGTGAGNPDAASGTTETGTLSIVEIKAIAQEGFIYGLPLVMNYAIMNEYAVDHNSSQFKAPFNHIKNESRVFTYKDTAVVTANSDTPYSRGWLDLRAEPIVATIPAVKNRYYSVMLNDSHTYNYGYMGSRATGGKAGSYMVVGPGWKGEKPAAIDEVFHSLTPFSLIAFRTQLMDPNDMPNVEKIQAEYTVQPLSAFLG